MAIAGFVLSFFCGLLGLILSIIGYNECKRSNGTVLGQGLALAGIIISSLMLVVGLLAAIAIPAFMGYMQAAKRLADTSEAPIQLNIIGKDAKIYRSVNGAFPTGSSSMLPEQPCCTYPHHKCPETTTTDPVWQAIDFQIREPGYFQYHYEGTADSFTATATGDLDCDGVSITYKLDGRIVGGNPELTLTAPPRNSD